MAQRGYCQFSVLGRDRVLRLGVAIMVGQAKRVARDSAPTTVAHATETCRDRI